MKRSRKCVVLETRCRRRRGVRHVELDARCAAARSPWACWSRSRVSGRWVRQLVLIDAERGTLRQAEPGRPSRVCCPVVMMLFGCDHYRSPKAIAREAMAL